MKVTKILSFAIASVMFFSSCNNDDSLNPTVKGDAAYMSVKLVDSSSARAVTQGPSEQGKDQLNENTISTLEFYIFDSTGARDSEYPYHTFAAGTDYSFAVSEGANKTLLVATNMSLGALAGATLEEVKEAILNTPVANPLSISTTGAPMAGEYAGFTASNGETTSLSVAVDRLLSKFEAPTATNPTVDLSGVSGAEFTEVFGHAYSGGEIIFDLQGYIVANGLKKSYAFPNYGVAEMDEEYRWNPSVWQIGNDVANYTASEYTAEKALVSAYSGTSFLTAGEHVYLYENSPKHLQGSVSGYEANTVYAMIVEAKMYDDGHTNSEGDKVIVTRYWRVNVNKTGAKPSEYRILRNSIYKLDITDVKTLGYGTPGEAEEEKPIIPDADEAAIEVSISVADWRVFKEGVII